MRVVVNEDRCVLLHGDSSGICTLVDDNSVDAVVTDPPSGTGFMGKGWDSDKGGRDAWIAWLRAILEQALAVLKPGGHALIWALPRTSHWTATAAEDAGFEIRDVHHHIFGTGFPKSLDISKAIDAQDAVQERLRRAQTFTAWMRSTGITAQQVNSATATEMGHHFTTHPTQPSVATADLFDLLRPLLPAVPQEIEDLVAQRTVESQNTKARAVVGERTTGRGTGAGATSVIQDNPDNTTVTVAHTPEAAKWQGWGTAYKPAVEHWILARKPLIGTYAENVTAYGTGALNIDACRVGSPPAPVYGGAKGVENGTTFGASGKYLTEPHAAGRWPAHLSLEHAETCGETCVLGCPVRLLDEQSGETASTDRPRNNSAFKSVAKGAEKARVSHGHADKGGASRFFYIAKGSRSEKDAGLEHLEPKTGGEATGRAEGSAGANPRAGAGRTGGARNHHPTVKSVDLMRWLVRLITPPGGTVLDLFAGSGTTGVAALAEGCSFIGVELGDEYIPIVEGRLRHALKKIE